jgi:uncharacterized protein (DUF1786 family)
MIMSHHCAFPVAEKLRLLTCYEHHVALLDKPKHHGVLQRYSRLLSKILGDRSPLSHSG